MRLEHMRACLATALMVSLLFACAPLTMEQRWQIRELSVRVCIRNSTAAMGDLRGWVDGFGRRYTIMSGHRQCRDFSTVGRTSVRIYVETIGGSAWGPTRAEAVVLARPGGCWEWDVRNNMSSDGVIQCRSDDVEGWGI